MLSKWIVILLSLSTFIAVGCDGDSGSSSVSSSSNTSEQTGTATDTAAGTGTGQQVGTGTDINTGGGFEATDKHNPFGSNTSTDGDDHSDVQAQIDVIKKQQQDAKNSILRDLQDQLDAFESVFGNVDGVDDIQSKIDILKQRVNQFDWPSDQEVDEVQAQLNVLEKQHEVLASTETDTGEDTALPEEERRELRTLGSLLLESRQKETAMVDELTDIIDEAVEESNLLVGELYNIAVDIFGDDVIREKLRETLPDFIEALDPIYQSYQVESSDTFENYLNRRQTTVTNLLLDVASEGKASWPEAMRLAYIGAESLIRDSVMESVPDLSAVMAQYMKPSTLTDAVLHRETYSSMLEGAVELAHDMVESQGEVLDDLFSLAQEILGEDFVEVQMQRILPNLVDSIDPLYQNFLESEADSFAEYLSGRPNTAASDIIKAATETIDTWDPLVRIGYLSVEETIRATLVLHIERMGELLERHIPRI